MHQIPSLLLQPSILGESGKPNDSTDVFASPVGTGSAVWMSFSLFDHLDCCQFDEFTGVSVVSPDPSTSSEAERICEGVFLLLHFVFLCTCCSWNCEPFSCFYLFLFSSRLHWSWRIFLSVVSERLNVRTSECLTSCPAVSYHVEQVASPLPPQRNSFRAWPAASPAAPISPPPVFGVQVTVNVIVGQSANTSTVPPQRRSDCSVSAGSCRFCSVNTNLMLRRRNQMIISLLIYWWWSLPTSSTNKAKGLRVQFRQVGHTRWSIHGADIHLFLLFGFLIW